MSYHVTKEKIDRQLRTPRSNGANNRPMDAGNPPADWSALLFDRRFCPTHLMTPRVFDFNHGR